MYIFIESWYNGRMDEKLIAEARALIELLESGTPAPWVHRKPPSDSMRAAYDSGFVEAPLQHPNGYGIQILGDDEEGYPLKKQDIALIIAARNDAPRILRELLGEAR